MEVLHDLEPKTNHIRLGPDEYLIVHTPKGTFDINVKDGRLDIGDMGSANYTIIRYAPPRSRLMKIRPFKTGLTVKA